MAKVVGQKLPNGKIKVIEGGSGEICESSQEFYDRYQKINEGANSNECIILECLNE